MLTKPKEKTKAIELRKKGLSYREILKEVSVAKSTLSLWLRSVGLSKKQKQRLTEKKLASALRGAMTRRNQRLVITKEIKSIAKNEIGKLSNRELWLIGTALYWAEGNKEREHSSLVSLGNSDPYLIKVFIKWLVEICKISKKDIYVRVYLHETARERLLEIEKYWSKVTGFPVENFRKVVWKKHKINTKRKNIGKDYYGLLRVNVKRSINFNRKITGWVEGVCKNCRVV